MDVCLGQRCNLLLVTLEEICKSIGKTLGQDVMGCKGKLCLSGSDGIQSHLVVLDKFVLNHHHDMRAEDGVTAESAKHQTQIIFFKILNTSKTSECKEIKFISTQGEVHPGTVMQHSFTSKTQLV